MKRTLRAAAVFLGGYLLVIGVTYVGQRGLQYHPNRASPTPPDDVEEVVIETADGVQLLGWAGRKPSKNAVLIFHGNGGDRSNCLDVLRGFSARGYRALIVDYRGYGGSGGSPSEAGLYADAEAGWQWLEGQGADRIGVWGYSLGTGVAVELASRHDEAFLVLDAPFDSALAIAKLRYPFLPVGWLMRDRYDSVAKIKRIKAPLLVFHGTADPVIPIRNGRALFDAALDPKWFVAIDGAHHGNLRSISGSPYWMEVDRFLDRAGH